MDDRRLKVPCIRAILKAATMGVCLEEQECQNLWNQIEPSLQNILSSGPVTTKQYMDLYTKIYKSCSDSGKICNAMPRPMNSITYQKLFSAQLYKRLSVFFSANIEQSYFRLNSSKSEDMDFLRVYVREWDAFEPNLRKISGIFSYINRYWNTRSVSEDLGDAFPETKDVVSVYGEGIFYWQKIVLDRAATKLASIALSIIDEDRRVGTKQENLALLKKLVETLVAVGHNIREKFSRDSKHQVSYMSAFGSRMTTDGGVFGVCPALSSFCKTRLPASMALNPVADMIMSNQDPDGIAFYRLYLHDLFISVSLDFFGVESKKLVADSRDLSIEQYLAHYYERITQETARVHGTLHVSSLESLLSCIEKCFIIDQVPYIFAEASKLLDEHESPASQTQLHNIFNLFLTHEDNLRQLKCMFEARVYSSGMSAIEQLFKEVDDSDRSHFPLDPDKYISVILKLHRSFTQLTKVSFPSCNMFNTSMDGSFCRFVNTNIITEMTSGSVRTSELLAKHCDSIMKRKTRMLESADTEQCFDNVMIVFNYIDDKDVFEKYYGKYLARRLVAQSGGIDQNAETSMIGRLRACCGFEYTQKLHRMFLDVGNSRSLNEEFRQRCHHTLEFEFFGLVATTGAWPFNLQPESGYREIPEFANACALFETEYRAKHSGRKITWLPQLGRVELRASFGKQAGFERQYLLQLSNYQTKIILLFDEPDTALSLTEIVEKTQIAENLVEQILAIFVKSHIFLLDQITQLYAINEEFSSKRYKINLNHPLKTEVKMEKEHIDRKVNEDRTVTIMATIVRVMKGRRTAIEEEIAQDVIKELLPRFKAKPKDIRNAIEKCIEKEYLAREDPNETAKDGPVIYKYLA